MPSTYTCLSYHIVFSTKKRAPLISDAVRERLYEYLGGVIRSGGDSLTEIGGVADHIHLLVKLKPTHTVADLLRVVKANSSKWVNEERLTESRFGWEEGYSAFTVSQSRVEAVRDYLRRQEEHHRKASFREKLQTLCERRGVEFHPEYFD